jgi:hypothetical protein
MADTTKVRIGLQGARELELQVDDADAAKEAIEKGIGDDSPVVWLTDSRGYSFGLITDKLAFVEIEGETPGIGVGFAAS